MALTQQQRKNFIEYIAPMIQKVGIERGYKVVSPFIAMACKEGNFGESKLAKCYSNHFGMKAGSSWKGKVVNLKTKEEYTVGTLTTIVDGFRVYEGATKELADLNGVNGFFDFISTKRYANVKLESQNGTPLSVLQAIKSAGYCTSSTYVNSCLNDYINVYNLTKYDLVNYAEKKTTTTQYPTLSLGMSDDKLDGKYIESWQNYLETLGMFKSNSAIKGRFEATTLVAVKMFQEANGLKADGIIGINTWKKSPAYKENR